jgi:hypothetical protein
MNIYRYQFTSRCPNNGVVIIYALTIESQDMIHVEHIVTAAALHGTAFHEAIADSLYARFNGRQTLVAHHHGVDVETRRGFEAPDFGRLTKRVQVGATVFEKGTSSALAVASIAKEAA